VSLCLLCLLFHSLDLQTDTAYNEMLSLFRNFSVIPIPLSKADGYHMHPDKIAEEIARGTSVILTSNPRNPTGQVLTNPQLAQIQDICRDRATLIMDEFYGGYNYTTDCDGTVVSAADNIDDVDEDGKKALPPSLIQE
jgi:aspartate/methionine/tyrosine aminotransferase